MKKNILFIVIITIIALVVIATVIFASFLNGPAKPAESTNSNTSGNLSVSDYSSDTTV